MFNQCTFWTGRHVPERLGMLQGFRRPQPGCVLRLALALAACVIGSSVASAQSGGNYVIGPQDVLSISVYDQPSLSGRYAVETDGTFSFPLIGRVKAAGLTLREFEAELRRQLADGFFRNPQVTVGVEQYRSQRVFVVGEVRQPGTYPLTGDMTLIEALAQAGSTAQSAAGEIIIVRSIGARAPVIPELADGEASAGLPEGEQAATAPEVIRVNIRDLESGILSQNVELRDGDTIFVPRAETIFVFGHVRSPGSYPIQKDTNVMQALSLAGGVTDLGATGRIRVLRVVDGKEEEVRVRLTDPVRPGDTIIVPQRFF